MSLKLRFEQRGRRRTTVKWQWGRERASELKKRNEPWQRGDQLTRAAISTSMQILFRVIFTLVALPLYHAHQINCQNELNIHGPGWEDVSLILPSRFFFIESPEECASYIQQVSITSLDGSHRGCLLRQELLNDTQSNTLIIRYRILQEECSNGLKISLLDGQSQLVTSKEHHGPIYGEQCTCLLDDFEERMKCNEFSEIYRQIDVDLKPFKDSPVPFKKWLDDTLSRFAQYSRSYSFCHYQIQSNQLFRKCYGEYVDFSQFFDAMMTSLLRKVSLRDTEFLVNLGDWPLSSASQPPIPIFSWCGSDDTYDIVLPTYEMTESVVEMQSRITVDVLALMGRQVKPWSEKEDKLFWRGRDSNMKRLVLRIFSKENPQLIDAAITNFFFYRSDAEIDKYGPRTPHVNFFDFGKYKYLANIDGTVAAYRLPFLLAINSLVLKQSSKYYEHFYHLLRPFHHYLPINNDLSDLHTILSRLTNTSDASYIQQHEQTKILSQTRSFVTQHLLPNHIYCYYYRAFHQYANIMPGVHSTLHPDRVTAKQTLCDCNDKPEPESHDEL